MPPSSPDDPRPDCPSSWDKPQCLPLALAVNQGVKYACCTCGQSAIHPLCDGTHRGTGARPAKFIAEKSEEVLICRCGRSASFPFCDGSHKTQP